MTFESQLNRLIERFFEDCGDMPALIKLGPKQYHAFRSLFRNIPVKRCSYDGIFFYRRLKKRTGKEILVERKQNYSSS